MIAYTVMMEDSDIHININNYEFAKGKQLKNKIERQSLKVCFPFMLKHIIYSNIKNNAQCQTAIYVNITAMYSQASYQYKSSNILRV